MLQIGRVRFHWLHAAGLLSILVVWEVAAHILARTNTFADSLLPPIETILTRDVAGFSSFGAQLGSDVDFRPSYTGGLRVLAEQSLPTLGRVMFGTIVGVLAGVLAGLAMSWSRFIRDLIEPGLQLVRMIPPLALIPLFLLWFGGREEGTLLYVSLAVFLIISINTLVSVENLAPDFAAYSRTLGATKVQTYRTVVIPGMIPGLIAGVRVALGSIWAIVLAAEFLAVPSGLGRLLQLSQMFLFTGRVIVVVLLFVAFSAIFNGIFLLIARWVTRWQPTVA